jgi:hypothetical protein
MNKGFTPGSFSSAISGFREEKFEGTYYQGWRRDGLNFGTIITNPVGGIGFHRYSEEESAKLLWKRRGARFEGAWTIASGSDGRRLRCTACGYSAGLSDVDGKDHWKKEQGQATDGGFNFAMSCGFRSKWIQAPKKPIELALDIWKRASRMLRAYTGFSVANSHGSSGNFHATWFLVNGNWEQLYASHFFCAPPTFVESTSSRELTLAGRGVEKIHLVDLMDIFANQGSLTEEVTSWNGAHPKFFDNFYKISDLAVSSFNGTAKKGKIERSIPFADLTDETQITKIAKCKNLVGGFRAVTTRVNDLEIIKDITGERHCRDTKITTTASNAVFNGNFITAPSPDETVLGEALVFQNIFVVNPAVNSPTEKDLLSLRLLEKPAARIELADRLKSKVIPSVETFPNSQQVDDGLLGEITKIVLTSGEFDMTLIISALNCADKTIGFMPVSMLLCDAREKTVAAHNAVATGNYGYGFLTKDPFSDGNGIPIFNTAPPASSFSGQERWHVPYKSLIGESWILAGNAISSSVFSDVSGVPESARENPYIFRSVSPSYTSSNRYSKYDLQIRPPTFLPLFMCAEMCHVGGSTNFARKLAEALIIALKIEIIDLKAIFHTPPPLWATDAHAYYESIVTLLFLGGFRFESYSTLIIPEVAVDLADDAKLIGSPSADFWLKLAEATGLDSVSDLITHCGTTNGIANVPTSTLVAASLKDPIGFAASMGVTVVKLESGYMIGSRFYVTLADLSNQLVEIAESIVRIDTANVKNIATSLSIPDATTIKADPKRYATPFNWFMLAPHVVTAGTAIATKVIEKNK